ncbi:hypothetical protein [Blastococcus sp. LR1]|uniref:hypothetical protein n=1 Tax=Blastococcus sp. LR1 TaxID=2877000 RepID=UPI001CCE9E03|nr:hypothetical protein [Blastococcus sp. LR1]MCA0146539.1 hypothetical protein [Blastococcus sp. LR1]
MSVSQWPCPTCGDDTEFVQPPCVDGHTEGGAECPEWACADCGTAIVTGDAAVLPAAAAARAA